MHEMNCKHRSCWLIGRLHVLPLHQRTSMKSKWRVKLQTLRGDVGKIQTRTMRLATYGMGMISFEELTPEPHTSPRTDE